MNLIEFKERMKVCRDKYKSLAGMTYEKTHSERTKNGWKYTFFHIKEKSIPSLQDILMDELKGCNDVEIGKHTTTDKNSYTSRISITVKWRNNGTGK